MSQVGRKHLKSYSTISPPLEVAGKFTMKGGRHCDKCYTVSIPEGFCICPKSKSSQIPIYYYQFSFRKGYRTSDAIFVLNSLLEKMKWIRKGCSVVSLTSRKLTIWCHMGSCGSCQTWGLVHKCLPYYIACIAKHSLWSVPGVRQGCLLSPTPLLYA